MAKSLLGLVCGLALSSAATLAVAQGPSMLAMPGPAQTSIGATAGFYPLGAANRPAVGPRADISMPMMAPAQYAPSASGSMLMPSTFQQPGAMAAPPMMGAPACGSCGSSACGGECCEPGCCPWYGSIGGLFLGRQRPNLVHLSFESTTPGICRMQANDPRLFSDSWGGEVMIGRRLGCCQNGGIEAIYWALDPMDERIVASVPGFFLNTAISLDNPFGGATLEIAGNTLDFWFDGAQEHSLERRNEIHNVEVNGLFWAAPRSADRRLALAILGGFRYFRFDEGLLFGALRPGGAWGGNGGLDEAYFDWDVTNDLIGGQLGFCAQFAMSQRWSLFATPKAGIFGNSMKQQTQVYRGDGLHALDLASAEGGASVLGQIDVGLNVAFTQRVSGYVGYRLIGISGIAQSDNQITQNVHLFDDIQDIDSSGDLVLNGGFAGLMFNY